MALSTSSTVAFAIFAIAAGVATGTPSHHHVLMIASDDMRPEMSPYGHTYMNTPNFQSIADDGYRQRACFEFMDFLWHM